MDTLAIVRRIREAEALAGQGNHSEAIRLLEPMLKEGGLGAAHRDLIGKKLDLLERQRQRVTRIMAKSTPQADDKSGESTVISLADPDPTERPTSLAAGKAAQGDPTETFPRLADRAAQTPKPASSPQTTLRIPPPTPQTTLMIPPPGSNLGSPEDTQQVPRPDSVKGRQARQTEEPEDDTPRPGHDPDNMATPPPVFIRNSRTAAEALAPAADDEEATYLQVDEHFAPKPAPQPKPQSTPDLKAMAEYLPEDDMRRDLAMEVVRLREELEKSRRKPPTGPAPTKRAERERPESGKFHIPAGQANTIVRRAAGSDGIEVHMPSRDEDIADLHVLRRDSVRGMKAPDLPGTGDTATDATDIGSGRRRKRRSPMFWLGAGVVLILAAGPVYLLVQWLLNRG